MSYLPFFETAWIVFQEQLPLFPQECKRMLRAGDHVADRGIPGETLGVIVSVEDDIAHVRVPEWMLERRYEPDEWKQEVWLETSELVRVDGYSIQELAGAIYGRMNFHHWYNVERNYFGAWRHARIACQHEECNNVAVGVGLINFLGTIIPHAMCIEHTEWHSMRCEYVPFTGKIRELIYVHV